MYCTQLPSIYLRACALSSCILTSISEVKRRCFLGEPISCLLLQRRNIGCATLPSTVVLSIELFPRSRISLWKWYEEIACACDAHPLTFGCIKECGGVNTFKTKLFWSTLHLISRSSLKSRGVEKKIKTEHRKWDKLARNPASNITTYP